MTQANTFDSPVVTDDGLVKKLVLRAKLCGIRLKGPPRRVVTPLTDRLSALTLADRRKDEFLAILSHELRSPLAAVRNALTVLRGPLGNDVTVQHAMLELIDRQTGQMSMLAEGLLDIGKIARGQLRLHRDRIDLAGVLSNAIETVQPEFDRRAQVFTTHWPRASVWVLADAARLEQVFVNLLTNASKFSDKAGRISLSLEAEAGQAVVRLKDGGIGIAVRALPGIFDLYMQIDVTAERSNSGVGVGLALVRRIVELHGGSVAAFSAGIGQGSEFVVRLSQTS